MITHDISTTSWIVFWTFMAGVYVFTAIAERRSEKNDD